MDENDLPTAGESGDDGLRGSAPGWSPPPRERPRLLPLAGLAVMATVLAIVISHAIPAMVSISNGLPRSGSSASAGVTSLLTRGLVDINVNFGLQGASGAATGMVLTPSGEVLTNNHVVDGATAISVTDIGNGRTYSASVVGYDRSRDLAVLQLRAASGLASVPIGDSAKIVVGAKVTAIGNAGGVGGTPSEATGRITALDQAIVAGDAGGGDFEHLSGLMETDAAIQPGDSGGPLVDSSGRVIAMDTASSVGYRLQSTATQGFAIPINQAVSIARQIEAGRGSSTVHIGPTAFLGVGIASPEAVGGTAANGSQYSGTLLSGVLSGSPADLAGLTAGDVITSLGGRAVSSGSTVATLLVPYHPGDSVSLQWVDQSGQTHSAIIRLASGPSS